MFIQSKEHIKICFVIDCIESPTAGTEKQLLLLLEHLDKSKFIPYLCVLHSSEWIRSSFAFCNLYEVNFGSFLTLSGWKAIYKFSRFLKEEHVDIVHSYFRDGGIVGFIAAKLAGIKRIIGSRRNQGFWYTRIELLLQRIMNRWTTALIANCENTRQWAIRVEGLSPHKIQVIYNALDIACYFRASMEQRKAFEKRYCFPECAVIVGLVANLRPVKDIDTFIKAAALIASALPQVYFIIVGDGPERRHLEALCSDLELQDRLHFLGKRCDISQILSCLDVGVLSSVSESFSNSIVEYMAAGLAVVCTDVGGAREAIENGVHGYVVEAGNPRSMADKIIAVIDRHSTVYMGQQGRMKAKTQFSLPEIMVKYQKLYEEVL